MVAGAGGGWCWWWLVVAGAGAGGGWCIMTTSGASFPSCAACNHHSSVCSRTCHLRCLGRLDLCCCDNGMILIAFVHTISLR